MSKEVDRVNVDDDSEFLEKEIERKAGELAYKRQLEDFEKDSNSGRFKVITQVVETLGALLLVFYILWEIWTSFGDSGVGKAIVIGIVLAIFSTFIFRYIARHYYLKGDTKKFRAFNTISKISEVSLSVADAVTPGGSKIVTKVEKGQDYVKSAITNVTKMSKLDDDGGVYVSTDYDKYRSKCYNIGLQVLYKSKVQQVTHSVKDMLNDTKSIPTEVKRDIIMSLFIVKDYQGNLCREVITESLYIQVLGALYCFANPERGLNIIPNFIPGIGYTDNMFMLNCVLAGNLDTIKKYRGWRYMYKKSHKNVQADSVAEQLKVLGESTAKNGKLDILKKLLESDKSNADVKGFLKVVNTGDVENDDVKLIIGYCAYYYAKDDLINDDIPDIGKVDDAYFKTIVENYLAENKSTSEESNLDNAIENLCNNTGG